MNQIGIFQKPSLGDIRRYLISCGFPIIKIDIFLKYHAANKTVYELFEQRCLQMIRAGDERISPDFVCHVLRRDKTLETNGEPFKISNTFVAYYGRVFVFFHGEMVEKFDFKPVGKRMAA